MRCQVPFHSSLSPPLPQADSAGDCTLLVAEVSKFDQVLHVAGTHTRTLLHLHCSLITTTTRLIDETLSILGRHK